MSHNVTKRQLVHFKVDLEQTYEVNTGFRWMQRYDKFMEQNKDETGGRITSLGHTACSQKQRESQAIPRPHQ